MNEREPRTELLLQLAREGDTSATEQLFDRHREVLKRMISVRMDGRMARRIDPSDVVQDTLAEASRRFSEYLKRDDAMFYPWLRHIAWERLVQLHRHHIQARRRSINREAQYELRLSDQSVASLSECLQARIGSPSAAVAREETRRRLRESIERLGTLDREVLVLRHLEQLPLVEVAQVLRITPAAVQSRYRRALERLHEQLSREGVKDDLT